MDLDPEVYLGTLLQNAARTRYRYVPTQDQTPSAFFAQVDPTPESARREPDRPFTHFPHTSLMSEVGLAGVHRAIGSWSRTMPWPPFRTRSSAAGAAADHPGDSDPRACGLRAGRVPAVHAGPDLTNHRIIPVSELGTDPSRVAVLKTTEAHYVPPVLYAFDTPIPPEARPLPVPTEQLDPQQIQLAFAYGGTRGIKCRV